MKQTTFDTYLRRLVYGNPTAEEVAVMYREVFIEAGEKKIAEFESVMRRMRIPIPEGFVTVGIG